MPRKSNKLVNKQKIAQKQEEVIFFESEDEKKQPKIKSQKVPKITKKEKTAPAKVEKKNHQINAKIVLKQKEIVPVANFECKVNETDLIEVDEIIGEVEIDGVSSERDEKMEPEMINEGMVVLGEVGPANNFNFGCFSRQIHKKAVRKNTKTKVAKIKKEPKAKKMSEENEKQTEKKPKEKKTRKIEKMTLPKIPKVVKVVKPKKEKPKLPVFDENGEFLIKYREYEVLASNFPFDVSVEMIKEFFESQSLKVKLVKMVNRFDGKFTGKCYVKFSNEATMNNALILSGLKFKERTIYVEKTISTLKSEEEYKRRKGLIEDAQIETSKNQNRSVFVNNLDCFLTNENIKELLSKFGDIESVRVVKNKRDENGKSIAFVDFISPVFAENCVTQQRLEINNSFIYMKYGFQKAPNLEFKTQNVNKMNDVCENENKENNGLNVDKNDKTEIENQEKEVTKNSQKQHGFITDDSCSNADVGKVGLDSKNHPSKNLLASDVLVQESSKKEITTNEQKGQNVTLVKEICQGTAAESKAHLIANNLELE